MFFFFSIQIRKPSIPAEAIIIGQPKRIEESTTEITIKKKPKKVTKKVEEVVEEAITISPTVQVQAKPEEVEADELTIRKEIEIPGEIISAQPEEETIKLRRPSESKPEDESTSQFTVRRPSEVDATVEPKNVEEISTEIKIKKKSKKPAEKEMIAEEAKITIPNITQETVKPQEEVASTELTIKKPILVESLEEESQEIESSFKLRKPSVPKEEVKPTEAAFTIRRPSQDTPKETKVEDVSTNASFKLKRPSLSVSVEGELTLPQSEPTVNSPVEGSFELTLAKKPKPKVEPIESDAETDTVVLPTKQEQAEYKVTEEAAEMTIKKQVSEEDYERFKAKDEVTMKPPIRRKESITIGKEKPKDEDEETVVRFGRRKSDDQPTVEGEFSVTKESPKETSPVEESFTIPPKPKPRRKSSVKLEQIKETVTLESTAPTETEYSIQEESDSITIKKEVSEEEFEKSKKVKKTKKKDEDESAKFKLPRKKSSGEPVESEFTVKKEESRETSPVAESFKIPKAPRRSSSTKSIEVNETVQSTRRESGEIAPSEYRISEESVEATIRKPVTIVKETIEDEETEFKFKRRRSSEAPVESEFTLKQTEPSPQPGSPVEESFTLPGKPKPRVKKPSVELDAESEKVILPTRKESVEYKVTEEGAEMTLKKVVSEEEYESTMGRKRSEDDEATFKLSRKKSSDSTVEAEHSLRRDSTKSTSSINEEFTLRSKSKKSIDSRTSSIESVIHREEIEREDDEKRYRIEEDGDELTIRKEVSEEEYERLMKGKRRDSKSEYRFGLRRKSSTGESSVEGEYLVRRKQSSDTVEESFNVQSSSKKHSKRTTRSEDSSESESIKLPNKIEHGEYKITEESSEATVRLVASESYIAETPDKLTIYEGEKVYLVERYSTDWWFVKKLLTKEEGLVPAHILTDSAEFTHNIKEKLHEKIQRLPTFGSKCFSSSFQLRFLFDSNTRFIIFFFFSF